MRKKLITMGLVSALGASTSALAVDLDATTPTPEAFATDTATLAEANTDGTFDLNFNSGGVVDTTAIGVGVAGGNQTFVRFDISASEFEGAVATANFSITGAAGTATSVAQGGADGDSFVVFDVTSNTAAAITQASLINFTPNVAASGTAAVTMTVYETLTGAVNQTDSLYSISGTYASFGEGLDVNSNAGAATAEVSTDFLQFTGSSVSEDIGDFILGVDGTSTNMNTGNTVAAITEMLTIGSTDITLTGDVSFGDWYIDETAGGCAIGGLVVDLVEDTDTFDNATANGTGLLQGTQYNLCVDVDGTEVINESAYSLTFEWDTGTRPTPAADQTISMGAISRNGTTVQIPYLTTFADYNQRLVVVNRGASDADYSITFTTEGDTTATAGTAATGTVPAGEVLSLKATDIVSLSGRTRTAATLIVVAPSANIDVATNQVNLSDGSTDTVVLD